ncbi:MAG: endonuclease/exonuclease/phosphatase family protein [Parachlamydia sp.]|nr:endonuclease/exonuclease/phosphatase family protein [Parachlamydia sp.]
MNKVYFCYQSLFHYSLINKIYRGSEVLVEVFKRSLDLVLPVIQILTGKQPTYLPISRFQKWTRLALALPGAMAILSSTPLLCLGKLVQCAVMSCMHPHFLHRPGSTQFPPPFSKQGQVQLKIGSLNVIGLPNVAFMLGDKRNGEIAKKRLPMIAKALKKEDLDIVCLQESFDLKGSRALTKAFPDRYILNHIGEQHPFNLGSGLTILSKYPIVAAHFVRYPIRHGIDKRAQKGIALAKVELGKRDGKTIVGYVATTHTQANTKNPNQCSKTRNLQLQLLQDALNAFIKGTSHPNEEIKLKMACGDFNFDNYRTRRPFLDRHEQSQPAIHRLFKNTIDPVVDNNAAAKPDNWVRPSDLPGDGTALHWKNPWAKSEKELLEDLEGKTNREKLVSNGSRRLDYTLFDQECHRYNQTIASKAKVVRSDNGLILTDHLLMEVQVTFDPTKAPQRLTRCVHQPLLRA